jgi:hypothetical protein
VFFPAEAVLHEQVISDAGWSKLDFGGKCKLVLLRLSLARNLEKLVMSLYGTDGGGVAMDCGSVSILN